MNRYEGTGPSRTFHFDGHPNDFRSWVERWGQPVSFENKNKVRVVAVFNAPEETP